MALISCPECGHEVSDKATICVNCGYPIKEYVESMEKVAKEKENYKCPECGSQNEIGEDYCSCCGMRLTPYWKNKQIEVTNEDIEEEKIFDGIYRHSFFKGMQEVHCPRCGSSNCSWIQQQHIIPGKTKTRYTANLNPFHPFTLVNKKEKIVQEERTYTVKKIMCNDCGRIFY